MTVDSILVLFGYISLHIFSLVQTDRCLSSRTSDNGIYRKIVRRIWITLYVLMALLPICGTFWPESGMKYTVMKIGNVTLGFDIYYCGFLLIFMLVDGVIVWIKKKRFDVVPPKAIWTMVLAIILAIALPSYAMAHAQHPVVTYWMADATRGMPAKGVYRAVVLGDLHMSVNSNPGLIEKAVALTNEQDPDAVFFVGDFFTSNYEGLENPELYIRALSGLQAKEGIYGVYGNHDVKENLFCGFAVAPVSQAFRQPEMVDFLNACGIRMLEDEVVEIADGNLVLAGRLDDDKAGDGTGNRMDAVELLAGVDPDKTILVLEHEPREYKDLVPTGAEIVFSGHTHDGQIWPCNLFMPLFSKNPYGYKMVNGMETFVTSGVGYFGPPQRSGTISEVMVVDITY